MAGSKNADHENQRIGTEETMIRWFWKSGFLRRVRNEGTKRLPLLLPNEHGQHHADNTDYDPTQDRRPEAIDPEINPQ